MKQEALESENLFKDTEMKLELFQDDNETFDDINFKDGGSKTNNLMNFGANLNNKEGLVGGMCGATPKREERKKSYKYTGYLVDDVDIPDDPFFLKWYRSFHNHPIDTNLMMHENLISDRDVHRKGHFNPLPKNELALEDLC